MNGPTTSSRRPVVQDRRIHHREHGGTWLLTLCTLCPLRFSVQPLLGLIQCDLTAKVIEWTNRVESTPSCSGPAIFTTESTESTEERGYQPCALCVLCGFLFSRSWD